jgi:GDP-L-fucose synthase
MKKILITGGAGFVGRHFCRFFLERGDEVHCVDSIEPLTGGLDASAGWPLFEPRDYANFHFYKEDCRIFFVRAADTWFDYVLHLAALVGGREMIEHNPLAVAEDLSIDSAYWQWAKKAQPGKTICFSSSAAYPIKYQRAEGYRLLTEDLIEFDTEIGMPDLSYGWAKLTHEYLARLAYQKHGLKSVAYRPFSGYGEDQDKAYPFPSICRRVLAHLGAPQIQVWGTGDQMRDFIHIDDCVRGVIATMDQVDDARAINLSTGLYTSFKQFARLTANLLGFEPEVCGLSTKPEGVFARGGDTALQTKLGFQHQIDFQTGIQRALTYFTCQSQDTWSSAGAGAPGWKLAA